MIWNLNSFKRKNNSCVRVISDRHTKAIRNAIWSKNETEIISVSFDESCALSDITTGQEINRLKCDNILTSVATHLDDERIVLCGSKNRIYAWDTRTSKPAKVYKSAMGQVQDMLFLNEKEFVACGDVVRLVLPYMTDQADGILSEILIYIHSGQFSILLELFTMVVGILSTNVSF